MFQRTLLRQSRAIRPVLSSSYSAVPFAIRASSRLQPQLLQPLVRQPAFRFYSTEDKPGNGEQKEAENENGKANEKENGKENGATESQEAPEDPVRKELEEKKKEVVDIKVISTFSR